MSGGESFAGITVPEGDPAGLNAAAGQFGHVAGTLSGVSGQLRSLPGSLAAWSGPASVSYAGACLTNGGACDTAVQALGYAERAARAYADELKSAQHRCRVAIQHARDAQHRIDAAERDLTTANAAIQAAAFAESVAATRASTAAAAGVPDLAAEADQRQAQTDGANAAHAAGDARRRLQDAQDDLRRAKKAGHDAMDDARAAAQSAAGAFAGAAGVSPVYAAFGAPGQGHTGSGGTPFFDWNKFWGGIWPFYHSNDAYARNKWFGDQTMGWAFEGAKDAAIATGGRLGRQAITQLESIELRYYRQVTHISPGVDVINEGLTASRSTQTIIDADKLAAAARWGRVGKALPVVGTVAGMASAGYDQWRDDSGNPNLTTTDRVGRAAGVGTYVGGAAAIGAIAGSFIPIPVGGTLAGAAVGALAGLAAGSIAVSIGPAKEFAAHVGQTVANGAVDAYHWSGDRLGDVQHGLQQADQLVDHQVDQATGWAGDRLSDAGHAVTSLADKIPTPHLPDLNPF